MEFRKIDEIQILDRARKDFNKEKLFELIESIKEHGFINPITITKHDILIAGHRRWLSAKHIYSNGGTIPNCPAGMVPVRVIEADEIKLKELELEENLRRQDLNWKEVVKATAELHKLKKLENPAWTLGDTAQAIGFDKKSSISHRITLAEHLDRPSIANAASEAEALRILKRELEAELRAAQAAQGLLRADVVLECCDGGAGCETLVPMGSVDLILTDPPYGIDADDFSMDVMQKHNYSDKWEEVLVTFSRVMKSATLACKPEAHAYVFCSISRFNILGEVMDSLGWKVWPRPLIWVKDQRSCPDALHGPFFSYECILFASMGQREVLEHKTDVLIYQTVKEKVHAAQKPVELLLDLMSRSVRPGHVVLDPFCGSGSTGVAAVKVGCKAYCFDIDEKMVAIAKGRLSCDM